MSGVLSRIRCASCEWQADVAPDLTSDGIARAAWDHLQVCPQRYYKGHPAFGFVAMWSTETLGDNTETLLVAWTSAATSSYWLPFHPEAVTP